jgi:hypothetical protein
MNDNDKNWVIQGTLLWKGSHILKELLGVAASERQTDSHPSFQKHFFRLNCGVHPLSDPKWFPLVAGSVSQAICACDHGQLSPKRGPGGSGRDLPVGV